MAGRFGTSPKGNSVTPDGAYGPGFDSHRLNGPREAILPGTDSQAREAARPKGVGRVRLQAWEVPRDFTPGRSAKLPVPDPDPITVLPEYTR